MSSHSCVHSQLIRYGRLDAACSLHPTRLPALRRSLIVSKITATKAVFGFQFSLSFACGALRSLLFIHRFFHFFNKFVVVVFCLLTVADFPIRRHSRCQSPTHQNCIFMRKYSPLHCLLADCIVIVVFMRNSYFIFLHLLFSIVSC